MSNTVHVYRDVDHRWRWRIVSSNGQTVGSSAQAFYSKWNAKRAARRSQPALTLVVDKPDPYPGS